MVGDDFKIWLNHFEYHAEHPRGLPRRVSDVLWPHERRRIASSIATFQLGEQSQGRRLLKAAERFAHAKQSPSLVRIVELLIREERRHAALLEAFMVDHRIPLKRSDWTDQVFRCARRLAGLELYLYVLMTAELIGIVYYRALERATDCRRLQLICRAFVADELAHVGFESHLLLTLRAGRSASLQAVLRWAHRAFFTGAAITVWLTHRTVLRHTSYSARSFVRTCLAEYAFYLEPASRMIRSVPAREASRPTSSLAHLHTALPPAASTARERAVR